MSQILCSFNIVLIQNSFSDQFTLLVTETILYKDYIETAQYLAHKLRNEEKCDLVVALTHLRIPNERILAQTVGEIDMLLGGHDHLYHIEMVNDVFFLKSGTDFEDFSDLTIHLNIKEEEFQKAALKDDNLKFRVMYSKSKKLMFECQRITINDKFEEGENGSNASRFVSAFKQHLSKDKLTLFSGDLFAPSTLSTFYKGEQMVEVFNALNVDIACLGNHDFVRIY